MAWATTVWSMATAVCLTLCAAHLATWVRQRHRTIHLIYAVMALSAAAMLMFEILRMKTGSPAEYGSLLRWNHLPLAALIFSLVAFVRVYLRAGQWWLLVAVCALRGAA